MKKEDLIFETDDYTLKAFEDIAFEMQKLFNIGRIEAVDRINLIVMSR